MTDAELPGERGSQRRGGLRRKLRYVALGLAIILVVDGFLPRRYELTTAAAVGMISLYRAVVSPRLEGRVSCRFEPSCSAYGLEAVREDGALVGGARAAWRIARCGPWTPEGTVDPP